MKKIALTILLMMPIFLFGQTYESLWKQVESAQKRDLPQTEQQVLNKIATKALKDKNYGQLLKAELQAAQSLSSVSPDSLKPAVERLQQREQSLKDPVLRAIYQTVLGTVFQDNPPLDENFRDISKQYYQQALQHPEQLAAVKSVNYKPFVTEGQDSRIYGDDLLSVIGYEAKRFDVLKDYYQKAGNRAAAMMSSLEWLRQQEPKEMESYANSVYLSRLDSLIEVYADLPEVAEVAIARYKHMETRTDVTLKEQWDYLENAIKRWGSWERMKVLRNKQKVLRSLEFIVQSDSIVLPNKPLPIFLRPLRGIQKLTMRVYRVNATAKELAGSYWASDEKYELVKKMLVEQPELTQTRTFGEHAPYENFEDSLVLPGLPVGVYMLEFESSPKTKDNVRVFYYVSDLSLLSLMLPDNRIRYVVVNSTTGQPVKGAKIQLRTGERDVTLTTDDKGEYVYKFGDRRPNAIFVSTADDKACPQVGGYNYFSNYRGPKLVSRATVLTDRAIYRPGQTVKVSVVAYRVKDGYDNTVRKGEEVTVLLKDANSKTIEERELITDEFGTCSTEFTLPRKSLTGQYMIIADTDRCTFRVEEYKRPTFEVEIPNVKVDYADGDTLQVKGTARSYAGVPVQDAKVRYKVERKRAFWWWSYSYYWNQGTIARDTESDLMAEGELTTDADGQFTVPTPMVLPKTRNPMFYNFVVSVDVTDQAGETHHGELSLPLGNRKTALSVDVPEKVLAEKGGKMTFHLFNAAGMDIDAQLRYRIDKGKWQKANTNKKIDLPRLKSGRYAIEAICGEDTIKRDFMVFSLDDKRPVTETNDWFFVSDSRFPNDGTPVTVQVGSSAKDVHVAYSIIYDQTVLESGTFDLSNQLWNRKFTYKEEYGNGLLLVFAWVKEGRTYTHLTNITRPVPDSELTLKWQTFRNRLEPGQQEEWALTITGPDGKPAKAQLQATLYDMSLDQLIEHDWSLNPYIWLPTPRTDWGWSSLRFYGGQGKWTEVLNGLRELEFNRFDHTIYPTAYIFGRNGRTVRLRGLSKGIQAATVNMAEFEGLAVTQADDALQGRIAGLDVAKIKSYEASSSAMRMTGYDDGSDEEMVIELAKGEQTQMRENLQETAFFYPQLMADSEGRVTLKFTLPEGLTTWRFMGVAHTEDMKTGFLEGEAVANKDVMIMPNLPRFIREGDHATLSARIVNTGEKAISGKARLELIDPETQQVVYAQEQNVDVAANATIGIVFPYDCRQATHSLLIAKMMVNAGGFSDGEQHYLPILSNKERVTKTVPFTQTKPGTKTIDLAALRSTGKNAKLTIEYTNNPAWLMIQALPTVGHPHDDCAICQATSFYANTIGSYILKQNPQAKDIFAAWSKEQGDETSLMSNLEKNQELKDLVLDETPWVADANREKEQKERLSDFFDANLIDQRLMSSLENLKKLQNPDGSWSWWPGMEGSMTMTVEISEMMVRLNQMTSTQNDTKKMLTKSFGFMGKEIVRLVKEMKKNAKKGWIPTFPSHMALQWLYICALDGRELPADVRNANTYLKNLLKKETRNQSIYDKAMSAIVLNNKTYVKSLKEYTVYREDMGRYYDTPRALYSWRDYRIPTQVAAMEAIQRLTPGDTKTIEEMQRWLLQEKRNQAWDTPINSVNAVYAFMNTRSSENTLSPMTSLTALKVDGQVVETSKATAGIGYVKSAMDGDNKQTFTAEKTSDGTSWGAVYMQFMQQTSEVETQSSGIKVKREILLSDINTSLHVGDRIKVRITIEADRDYDFVQVIDKRAACMEPVNQLSGYRWGYYIAPKDCSTNYYFNCLSKGKHVIETEYYIDRVGTYETGTCTASCAYSPEFRGVAKSQIIEVK